MAVVVGSLAPPQPEAMAVSACVIGLWSWLTSMLFLLRYRLCVESVESGNSKEGATAHIPIEGNSLLFFKGWKPRVLKRKKKQNQFTGAALSFGL